MGDIKHDILYKYWKYTEFRSLQEEIIDSILAGFDTIGLLPTGGGKSLTFQVPGMINDGLTVVITPIISLMKDQVDNLRQRNIKAVYLHSGLSMSEMRRAVEKCANGNYKFLYISPERLGSDSFIDNLRHFNVSQIVVDEAHCISQWGYDFRPSFLKISKIRSIFPTVPVLALTASATEQVVNDISIQLKLDSPKIFRNSFARDNISYVVRKAEDKLGTAIHILESVAGSAIIYVRNRLKTKEIAEMLCRYNIPATYYHAGLSSEEKDDKQNKWKNGEIRVMVATNAFGMGIDKPDVRLVIHVDSPSSLEEYYQEAGRAGRDGKRSYAVLIASVNDKVIIKRRLNDLFPDRDFIRNVYDLASVFLDVPVEGGYNRIYDFNFQLFCNRFKLPVRPTFSALKLLTMSGYIEFIEEIETQSRILVVANKNELYNIATENIYLDSVLQFVLRTYTGIFMDYAFISESVIAYKLGIKEECVLKSLVELGNKHIFHYIPRKRTSYILYTTSRELSKYVQIPRICYEDRKAMVENRMKAMLDYIYSENLTCREKQILSYFGETELKECNHCDLCISRRQMANQDLATNVYEGVTYMLSLKDRKLKEFISTLSFPKDEIINCLRKLMSEDIVFYNPDTEIYSIRRKN